MEMNYHRNANRSKTNEIIFTLYVHLRLLEGECNGKRSKINHKFRCSREGNVKDLRVNSISIIDSNDSFDISWNCPSGEICCDYGCCQSSVYSFLSPLSSFHSSDGFDWEVAVISIVILFIFLLLLLFIYCCYCRNKREEKVDISQSLPYNFSLSFRLIVILFLQFQFVLIKGNHQFESEFSVILLIHSIQLISLHLLFHLLNWFDIPQLLQSLILIHLLIILLILS